MWGDNAHTFCLLFPRRFRAGNELSALKAHLERMKNVQDIDQQRFDEGRISVEDLSQSKYYRLEAEIWLERAKMGKVKLDIEIRERHTP